jgi:Ca2+-binding RTX toxin-like protein
MSNSASAQVRVDIGGGDGVPHTFISVTHPDGKQTEYGMVPATHLSPEGPGKIDITGPDSPSKIPHEYDISGPEVTLTDQQYRDLMRDIDASIKNPPGYILPGSWWPGQGTNCTGWVVDLWTKHKLPKQLAVTNKWVWNPYGQGLILAVNRWWQGAMSFTVTARDPLAIDLDNDGIETVAINPAAPLRFDHDGDGAPSATGWLQGDDGWLVNDLDLDGKITSGKELLGVDTDITVGGVTRKATTGFEALRALDSHQEGDGKNLFDSRDAAFSKLRVWRDKNQNGATDAGELSTLSALGIVSIQLQETPTNINLPGGNSITGTAKVTRRVGTSTNTTQVDIDSVLVSSDAAANLNLAENPFYTDLPDLPVNDTAQVLPDMQGSGFVYSLREAMSLGNAASNALTSTVQAFAAANTRATQLSLVDKLIAEWGATSKLVTSGNPSTIEFGTTKANPSLSASTQQRITTFAQNNPEMYRKVIVLEQFNGQMGLAALMTRWNITLPAAVTNSLNAAYAALSESVYGALATQTRLKPYLDAISLTVDDQGLRFDTTTLAAKINATMQADAGKAIEDLVDLVRFDQSILGAIGFDGAGKLRELITALPADSPILAKLQGLNLLRPSLTTGTDRNDVYLGDDKANSFNGGAGNDVLDGGKGNDALSGGDGADTYIFGKGSGQDTINNGDADAVGTNADTVTFVGGLSPSDITLARISDYYGGLSISDLVIRIKGTDDKLTIKGFFTSDGTTNQVVERFQFSNGVEWDVAAVRAAVTQGTDGSDSLYGFSYGDSINGGNSNDTINGADGNDTLDGGAGDDWLKGDAGNDTLRGDSGKDLLEDGYTSDDLLDGGSGNDTLRAGAGNDTLDGGADNDLLEGGKGADTYLFGIGSGNDRIDNSYSDEAGGEGDTIQLGAGIGPEDLILSRVRSTGGYSSDLLDLLIGIKGSPDTLQVGYFFDDPKYLNDVDEDSLRKKIRFANGDIWDAAKIKSKTLKGTVGNDSITGYATNDEITGSGGQDSLYGEGGDDTLLGGDGNDNLSGGSGQDWLHGGMGDDYLNNSAGNDFVVFSAGHGNDTVASMFTLMGDPLNMDTLVFDATLNESDYAFTAFDPYYNTNANEGIPEHMKIKSRDSGEEILVEHQFYAQHSPGAIKEVRFEKTNKVLSIEDLKSQTLQASHRNDRLFGFASSDNIQGRAGADSLYGNAGDDTLDGGIDADSLDGGSGNDTLYGGTGNDKLDGDSNADRLFGEKGDDELWGGEGDDTLDGGEGNDRLLGGGGIDTFVFARNGGADYIESADGTADQVVFAAGLRLSDLTFSMITDREYTNYPDGLRIAIKGTSDSVTLRQYFKDTSTSYVRDAVVVEGITLTPEWILGEVGKNPAIVSRSNGTLYGTGESKTYNLSIGTSNFRGGNGNETIISGSESGLIQGGAGNDSIIGGLARDYLYGDDGDDTIDGGQGNDDIAGGKGANTYILDGDSENDYIKLGETYDPAPTASDKSIFRIDAPHTDVRLYRSDRDHLMIRNIRTGATTTVAQFFPLAEKFDSLQVSIAFSDQVTWQKADLLTEALKGSLEDDLLVGYTGADTINGGNGADTLRGNGGADQLNGGAGMDTLAGDGGNDVLNGGRGWDSLHGGADNDTLDGEEGFDTMDGGAGDDSLYGGGGADTYLHTKGEGRDVIFGQRAEDVLKLSSTIAPADVRLERYADNLDLVIMSSGAEVSRVVLINQALDGSNLNDGIKQIEFGDAAKTVWDMGIIRRNALTGTQRDNPNIRGYASNDSLSGLGGSDVLRGQGGSDTLEGGVGNDILYGDAGTDTYIYNKGDGYDVIYGQRAEDTLIMKGFKSTDVTFNRTFSDINITQTSTSTSYNILTLVRQALDGTHEFTGVSQIAFDDKTITADEIRKLALQGTSGHDTNLRGYVTDDTIYGQDGNDSLFGESGSDKLYGGAGLDLLDGGTGNDYLGGGIGNDTYRFSRGGGQDSIVDIDATVGNFDVLQFQSGIAHDQLWFSQSGNNLKISIIGTSDQVTIAGGGGGSSFRIEQLTAGGKTLSHTQVANLVQAMASMTPPVMGQTTLSAAQQAQLAPVLAANWS